MKTYHESIADNPVWTTKSGWSHIGHDWHKSKASYVPCPKCGLAIIRVTPSKNADYGQFGRLCSLCYYKQKKWYTAAKELLKQGFCGNGWYGKPPIKKVGWSFAWQVYSSMMFASVLNMGSLNKTPKLPGYNAHDYISEWKLKTAHAFYGE